MATWEKIKEKLVAESKNITFDEIKVLLEHYGYHLSNKGRTSGSRVAFIHDTGRPIVFHKPHPAKELKKAVVVDIKKKLEEAKWL
ncbi:MAG: type II toxin-antitoxin system HicA family toxin [Clostridiales bacterium]|nr:type II toxin-antitoxin system HicA family toxin [Clostridiales bacterium]